MYAAGEVTGGVHGKNRLMGNSLLDVLVFGRRAGIHAVELARSRKDTGKPTLKHVDAFNKEVDAAGIKVGIVSPILLPDYAPDHVRARQRE